MGCGKGVVSATTHSGKDEDVCAAWGYWPSSQWAPANKTKPVGGTATSLGAWALVSAATEGTVPAPAPQGSGLRVETKRRQSGKDMNSATMENDETARA